MAAGGDNEMVCEERVSKMLGNGDSTSVLLTMAYRRCRWVGDVCRKKG